MYQIWVIVLISLCGVLLSLDHYRKHKKRVEPEDVYKSIKRTFLSETLFKSFNFFKKPEVSVIDLLPWVVSFGLLPVFHVYCYGSCNMDTFYWLFSTLVQIFGALLGLLLIAFFNFHHTRKKSGFDLPGYLVELFSVTISSMITIVTYSIIILALTPFILSTGVFGELIFYFGGITLPIIAIFDVNDFIKYVIKNIPP
jgi:hypothetical protein